MIHEPQFLFLRHDSDTLPINTKIYLDLLEIYDRGGVLFWCNEGEWRAIGGPRLRQHIQYLWDYQKLGRATLRPPDLESGKACYFQWDEALVVPSELVRWLRDETEQLGDTDTSTKSTAK